MTKHEEKPTHHGPKAAHTEEPPEHHGPAHKKSAPPPPMPSKESPAFEQDEPTGPAPAKTEEKPQRAAAKQKAKQPGCTLCRVTGTSIKYNGKRLPEGTVAEFDDATVLDMPGVLVSQE
jgi:hypothetical protein